MTLPGGWARVIAPHVASGRSPSPELIAHIVDEAQPVLGGAGVAAERHRLEAGLLGLGPLSPFVADPSITDILVNGDGSVWIDRGDGTERTGLALSPDSTRALAVRLAGQAGRRLDDAQPWVDGLLPGSIRLHAVLPPIVASGAHLSLRVPRVAPAGLLGLIECGTIDQSITEVVRSVLEARLSFMVVGGTGSGKTTLLGGLLAACPPTDRLVIVEDVRELNPGHPHVVHLQGRAANIEGAGSVTMVDLVRQALRMRPDRLVVGEVRGAEVRELLAALNTGHTGSGGTVHANSVGDLPARIEALGALAGLSPTAIGTQLIGGLNVVLGMARLGRVRRLTAIGVVRADRRGRPVVDVALDLAKTGPGIPGPGHALFSSLLDGVR